MYTMSITALAALSALLTPTQAWGNLGHETIAYIAQNFVQDHTVSWAQAILDDKTDSYMANVATWADTYRYTSAGAFSAPYHFIDAEDSPPKTCNVAYTRDCGKAGCSISAIANYTRRVQQPSTLPAVEINHALRFLIHFIGDITQPLHDEALEVGGNDIDVTFDKTATNLHHIWDTNMPEQLRGGYSLSDAKSWAANLTTEINNGSLSEDKASWARGIDFSDPITTALGWATDANRYVCSVVIPNGTEAVQTGDLYPEYYDTVIPTIELQIAKAGYRLAKWLDLVAANQTVGGSSRRRASRGVTGLDLSGMDLLPPPSQHMSLVKLRREAIGWGCSHEH